ncbi:unnamed protein product (macronuclear) [Paramecium tetraurelia]|uniref:Uncharacterized protein n=1 Tax=Paramecium tetraurelia TaxID=5888 RepID=A0BIK5_PARTE|nr:uncharacterized protein GSPATT00004744001 [Paramecium tetraurelia]CAK58372.1 unnamed protein product [Paramecium tetraurelia]|eukprot:XP_001425770.1 hypothetical protein (macronuclear) [Paramecium tetraurelia strain d4-2]
MGCVTTKNKPITQEVKPPLSQNSQPLEADDEFNYHSAPQSPALKKIVRIGALTHDEIKDFITERRHQNNSTRRIELMKKSGRYTPTIIYKYRQQSASFRSPSKATNISPIQPTQK